jgi:hypothetical protein
MGGPARVMSWATREIGPEAEMIRQFRFALGFLAQATRGNRRWASAWRCSLGCTLRVRMTRRVACCKFEWLEGSRVGNSGDLLGHALRVHAVCRDRPCATAVERAPRQTEGRSEHRLGPIGLMGDMGQDVRWSDHVGPEWIERALARELRMQGRKYRVRP